MDIADKLTSYLTNWIQRFLQNKDLILRRYSKIERFPGKEDQIMITHKDGAKHFCVVVPFVGDLNKALEPLKEYEQCTLVCYNTKENFDVLVNNWERLVNFKKHFHVYFVNPFSNTLKQWAIYPHTHQIITQGQALKLGLTTLFQTVEATTKEGLEKKIEKECEA